MADSPRMVWCDRHTRAYPGQCLDCAAMETKKNLAPVQIPDSVAVPKSEYEKKMERLFILARKYYLTHINIEDIDQDIDTFYLALTDLGVDPNEVLKQELGPDSK